MQLEDISEAIRPHPYLITWAIVVLLLFAIRRYQSRPTEFFYNKKDPLFNEFLAKSNITKMVYKPHPAALTPLLQGITLLAHERVY